MPRRHLDVGVVGADALGPLQQLLCGGRRVLSQQRVRSVSQHLRRRIVSTLLVIVGVFDTLSDSIQCLNFAKKRFIQYSIQYCFTQDSIQNIIQFKKNLLIQFKRLFNSIVRGSLILVKWEYCPKNDSFNIRFNIALPKIQFKTLFNSKNILLVQFKR